MRVIARVQVRRSGTPHSDGRGFEMARLRLLGIAMVLTLAMGVANVFAQGTSASISGVVRDASQAVVAGATVTATNTETSLSRTATSDSQGRYRVGELPPGAYQINVTMPGFASETRKGINLLVG